MPTYEYECTKCGFRFEKFQGMSEPPVERCPECNGPVRRLLSSGGGIIVKGNGTGAGAAPGCGRERPCCGREERCDKPPCGD